MNSSGNGSMNRSIFLDRDGTINEDVGFIWTPDKLIFIPGSIEALKMLQEEYILFIITNQSGIGQGIFSEEDFLKFNRYFIEVLGDYGIHIKDVYYCPHSREQNCKCHKPNPYFIRKAEENYDIDLKHSWVIGDHPHDVEMAHRVGAHSVYLLTGHGAKHLNEISLKPDYVARDIYDAAEWILNGKTGEVV